MFPETPSEKLHVIADAVLKLSDFYIQNPSAATPWHEKYCQLAYRHYFLPLNYIRNRKVIQRGLEVGFFEGLKTYTDWGSGPGTASLAIADALSPQKQILFDHSEQVFKSFSDLKEFFQNPDFHTSLWLNGNKESCLVFSYSLTEVTELPAGWKTFEALMILEPSTSQDGRKLMQLREKLLQDGFHLWAPCTHHLNCPLLTHSKNDWCHDRAVVDAPEWFWQLEQLLPMKNKTVTTSYLLARKKAPLRSGKARLTGDSLDEKGKTRQLICRGDQREFLTWMHKSIKPQTVPRGDLVDLNSDFEIKSNELRLKAALKI